MTEAPRFHPNAIYAPRLAACDCGHISCVCRYKIAHDEKCKFRIAATCAFGIACDEHNRDVCPICDPCTCEAKP